MLIEVKEEDWRNYLAIRNKRINITQFAAEYTPTSECCPITFALKRVFGVEYAQVTYNKINVGMFPDNIIFDIPTSDAIKKWLKHYDADPLKNFTPVELEIELPADKQIS